MAFFGRDGVLERHATNKPVEGKGETDKRQKTKSWRRYKSDASSVPRFVSSELAARRAKDPSSYFFSCKTINQKGDKDL
jgi:hypothetical protein